MNTEIKKSLFMRNGIFLALAILAYIFEVVVILSLIIGSLTLPFGWYDSTPEVGPGGAMCVGRDGTEANGVQISARSGIPFATDGSGYFDDFSCYNSRPNHLAFIINIIIFSFLFIWIVYYGFIVLSTMLKNKWHLNHDSFYLIFGYIVTIALIVAICIILLQPNLIDYNYIE